MKTLAYSSVVTRRIRGVFSQKTFWYNGVTTYRPRLLNIADHHTPTNYRLRKLALGRVFGGCEDTKIYLNDDSN